MLKDIFFRRVVFGTLLLVVVIIAGGILYLKHLEVQRQREIAETASRVKSLTPTQMATQTASGIEVVETETGGGHFHTDGTWYAEPHEPVIAEEIPFEDGSFEEIVDPDLVDFTDAELATYERVKLTQIKLHWAKYPDCQDHEAVFSDADRFSRWYVKDKAYRKKRRALYEEWEKIAAENDKFFDDFYLNKSAEERAQFVKNMSDAERVSFIAKLEDWEKRKAVAFQRYDEVDKEEPTKPKRLHMH